MIAGALATRPSEVLRVLLDGAEPSPTSRGFLQLLEWADGERRLRIRANADTPRDARVAAALGAEGIGLCRTEHMFFADERIPWVRQMILAEDAETPSARRRARQAPPHAAAGLRGDLRGARRPADHRPPARSAAPRVPAPRREVAAHPRQADGDRRRRRQGAGGGARRVEPDARPARLPPGDHRPRDLRDAGRGDRRAPPPSARGRATRCGRRSWSRWSAPRRRWSACAR